MDRQTDGRTMQSMYASIRGHKTKTKQAQICMPIVFIIAEYLYIFIDTSQVEIWYDMSKYNLCVHNIKLEGALMRRMMATSTNV